jgi:hypothetical protein
MIATHTASCAITGVFISTEVANALAKAFAISNTFNETILDVRRAALAAVIGKIGLDSPYADAVISMTDEAQHTNRLLVIKHNKRALNIEPHELALSRTRKFVSAPRPPS